MRNQRWHITISSSSTLDWAPIAQGYSTHGCTLCGSSSLEVSPIPYLSNKQTALTPLCFLEHENRGKSHSNRVGRPEGGDLRQYHPMSITGRNVNYRPQQRNQKEIVIIHRPQQEEMYIVPPIRNPLPQQLSQWETVITPNFHVSPRDFPSKPPPPANLPLTPQIPSFFFIKLSFFSSFVGLAYEFCCSLLVWNCSSLLFQNKPIFW